MPAPTGVERAPGANAVVEVRDVTRVFVIVTHDVALARRLHRILTMRDGAIVSEQPS